MHMNYQNLLERIYQEILPYSKTGSQADYIPALAKVDPDQFGISLKLISLPSLSVPMGKLREISWRMRFDALMLMRISFSMHLAA